MDRITSRGCPSISGAEPSSMIRSIDSPRLPRSRMRPIVHHPLLWALSMTRNIQVRITCLSSFLSTRTTPLSLSCCQITPPVPTCTIWSLRSDVISMKRTSSEHSRGSEKQLKERTGTMIIRFCLYHDRMKNISPGDHIGNKAKFEFCHSRRLSANHETLMTWNYAENMTSVPRRRNMIDINNTTEIWTCTSIFFI